MFCRAAPLGRKRKTLFLARDRFGRKAIVLISGWRTISLCQRNECSYGRPEGESESNQKMVFNFITTGYNANPLADGYETFFQGIRKLPARNYLTYHAYTTGLEVKEYWDLLTGVTEGSGAGGPRTVTAADCEVKSSVIC